MDILLEINIAAPRYADTPTPSNAMLRAAKDLGSEYGNLYVHG
jgi:hypothetical protein